MWWTKSFVYLKSLSTTMISNIWELGFTDDLVLTGLETVRCQTL